jgi:hypothetical protein
MQPEEVNKGRFLFHRLDETDEPPFFRFLLPPRFEIETDDEPERTSFGYWRNGWMR